MSFEDKQTSFFATLYSSDSKEYFPANNTSDFRNRLQLPINNDGDLEVGLVELHYSDNFEPESPVKPAVAPKPVPVPIVPKQGEKKFFNNPKDGIINTMMFVEEVFRFKKDSINMPLKVFISKLTQHFDGLTNRKFKLAFGADITPAKEDISDIRFETSDDLTLELSTELAQVLGYDTTRFQAGTFKSSRPMDLTKFLKFSVDQLFVIRIWKYIRDTVIVAEPTSYDWEDLASDIVVAMEAKFFDIGFIVSTEDDIKKARIYIETPNLEFQFSKRLNRLLGKPESHWFRTEEDEFIIPPDQIPVAPPPVPEKPEPVIAKKNLLLVHSNLVYPQYFGNCMLPLLRTVSRPKSINSETILQFDSVHYLPLKDTHVPSIHLQLTDEHLKLLPFMDKPTTALLHFRARY